VVLEPLLPVRKKLGRVYDLFRRWQRDGTWQRIFTALQARADARCRTWKPGPALAAGAAPRTALAQPSASIRAVT
jgi:transposase